MGNVVIVCPHSGREISTGIEMDAESFGKLPDVAVRSRCPDCGMQHAWWTREAKLQDGGEKAVSSEHSPNGAIAP